MIDTGNKWGALPLPAPEIRSGRRKFDDLLTQASSMAGYVVLVLAALAILISVIAYLK